MLRHAAHARSRQRLRLRSINTDAQGQQSVDCTPGVDVPGAERREEGGRSSSGRAMGKRALLLCSSTDGQARRICERLCRMLEDAGAEVTLTMIDDVEDVAPASFDLVVVGARIRYSRTDARVIDFAPTARSDSRCDAERVLLGQHRRP